MKLGIDTNGKRVYTRLGASMATTTHALRSSWIESASYDDQTRSLVVTTRNGGSYEFLLVPPDVVEQFVGSESPGKFFHAVLKGY